MWARNLAMVSIRHMLLARMTLPWRSGDEPMVIPDTHADWRFAKNVKLITFPSAMN